MNILSVRFDTLTMEEAADKALFLMKKKKGCYVCTPNPNMVLEAQKDPAFCSVLNQADLSLIDGIGIVWAARYLYSRYADRVSGYDFMMTIFGKMEGTVYLYGSRPEVLSTAVNRIKKEYPKISVCGYTDGYSGEEEDVLQDIILKKPDFVIVCLGMKKQEFFISKLKGREGIGLCAGLGGSLDVFSGKVCRARDFYIRHNIEWLFRLVQEPKRFPRIARLPFFVFKVIGEKICHGKTDCTGRN